MSKKNKKKGKSLKYYDYESDRKSKKRKGKGSRKSVYKAPKGRDIKETLSKKDAKENKKIVVSPVDVPKDFKKNRNKCNHAGTTISVAEYQNMTPAYAAYTPALDRVADMFGTDNTKVCKSCFDVVVNRDQVESEKVYDCLTYLYAAVNVALANRKLKDDEVKEISKLKDVIFDFQPVLDILNKLESDAENQKPTSTSGLNQNPGGAFVK